MTSPTERRCPDCSSPMHDVQLIDHAQSRDTDLNYTVAEARRSFWTGAYPVMGTVKAFMCDQCGRIVLYGAPKDGT